MNALTLCNASLIALLFSTLLGCGDGQATVKGTVTFKGQPLTKGEITFTPAGGTGTPVGAAIASGKYSVKMLPGEKTALITETFEVAPILSTEEMQKQAEAGVRPAPPPKRQISETTKGNNKAVTIKNGEQTIDFPLEP